MGSEDLGSVQGEAGQLGQIAFDTLIDLLQAALHLRLGKVAIAVIDCFDLTAIDGHEGVGKQVELTAQHHEFATHQADRLVIVLAKVCQERRQPQLFTFEDAGVTSSCYRRFAT